MTSTADEHEVEHFIALATEWWNYDGPYRVLHAIGPLRMQFVLDNIRRHFPLSQPHRMNAPSYDTSLNILDVGCGGGLISLPLAKLGNRVCGIDAVSGNIDAARNYAKKYLLDNLQYNTALAESHELEHSNFYDVIIAFEVIEHISAKSQFLSCLCSMLKPGGLLLISTISRSTRAYVVNILLGEKVLRLVPRGTHEYKKLISPGELSRILEGMKIVDLQGLRYDLMMRKWLLNTDCLANYMIALTSQ